MPGARAPGTLIAPQGDARMVGQVPSRQRLTLLVHCDLDAATAARTALAVDLARRTGARLVGVAAGTPKRGGRRSAARSAWGAEAGGGRLQDPRGRGGTGQLSLRDQTR